MMFNAIRHAVLNRGLPKDSFLKEEIEWARTAPDELFDVNDSNKDIYVKIKPELGPWKSLLHRKAAMLETMTVLAMFESSGDWTEGVDTSRLGGDTPLNSEAGAWQVSYDSKDGRPDLQALLLAYNIHNGVAFQQEMKFNHPLAMEYVVRLMRRNSKHNGPLYKGDERLAIRRSLRGSEHSIYPWLSRSAVDEYMTLLS